jgi:hypothetical protein
MRLRCAGSRIARPLNCGVMRLSSVIRWLLLVPCAVAAWYFAVVVSVVLREIVVGRCLGSDAPLPEYCQASWFPLKFLDYALLFLGVGLSAVVVVVVAAVVAPSHKSHVAWVALGAGAILATVMGYSTGAVAEAAVAIASGVLAAVVMPRTTIGSRDASVAPTNVVPNA